MIPFSVSTQLTQKDFVDFNKIANPLWWVVWVFFAVGVFMLATVALRNTSAYTAQLPFPFTELLVGLGMVSLPFLSLFLFRRNFKNNPTLHGPIAYHFSETAMDVQGDTFSATVAWGKVQKVTENKRLLVFWQSPQLANILPKRYLDSSQIADIKALAQTPKPQ